MSLGDSITRKLKSCTSLASLPTIALQVLDLSEDPDTGLIDVEKVIQNDPALSAKLIRVANSPLFSRGRCIDSTLQALTLLGLDSALALALSFSLMGALKKADDQGDSTDYWRRSLIAAISARELANTLKLNNISTVFLAGLLQDIGILALKQLEWDSYSGILSSLKKHDELAAREIEQYGADHAAIGQALAISWKLPIALANAIGESHSPITPCKNDDGKMIGCVALASLIADVIAYNNEVFTTDFKQCAANLGINEEQMGEVIDNTIAQLPELANLFDIQMMDASELSAIQDKSKEVLLMRTVHSEIRAREQAEVSASIERRSRNLEEIARRDGLTGVYNRSHLDSILAMEFSATQEHKTPLSVAFIDLDYFKKINDNYGHQAGDLVLRHIAGSIEEQKRLTDTLARYGGEEFLLVMPGTTQADAHSAAKRMLEHMRNAVIELQGGEKLTVTASIGIATQDQHADFNLPEQLVNAADIALYDAKQGGRDQVCIYQNRIPENASNLHKLR
jgi:diguanylate cyclase (GGDEF)-like protein